MNMMKVVILYDLEINAILQRKVLNDYQVVVKIENLKAGLYLYQIVKNEQLLQNGNIIVKN